MRAGKQLRSRLRARAEHVADAVDRRGEACLGQMLREPVERAQMRFRKCRLVHTGLVGADGPQRVEVGEHTLAIEAAVDTRHGWTPELSCRASIPSWLDATGSIEQTIS